MSSGRPFARAGCRACARHPRRLPRYPSPCEAGASPASRLLGGPRGAAARHSPLARPARREARAEGSARLRGALLVSPHEHPIVTNEPPRRPGVPTPRACQPKIRVPAMPREGHSFPTDQGCFSPYFHAPRGGFPRLGEMVGPSCHVAPLVEWAWLEGDRRLFFARPPRAQP